MKYLSYIIIIFLLTGFDFDNGKPEAIPVHPKISGTIIGIKLNCGGGANIPDNWDPKPYEVPLNNFTFYIKNGEENKKKKIIKKFTTDINGNFEFDLPSGTYCMVVKEQTLSKKFHPELYSYGRGELDFDKKCYKEWWSKCITSFTVDQSLQMDTLKIQFPCEGPAPCPCITIANANTRP